MNTAPKPDLSRLNAAIKRHAQTATPIPRISIHEAYGLGAKKIKAVCDLPLPEAEKLIASYRAAHPAAARLFDLTSRRVAAPENSSKKGLTRTPRIF